MTAVATVDIIQWLDSKIQEVYEEVVASPLGKTLLSPDVDPAIARAVLREIFFDIASYQPTVIEKTISAIGQMPRVVDPRRVQSMLVHQADEFDHGEMAIRDYVALGGAEATARNPHNMTPAAHAVAAFWALLEHQRDPFAYLGALYLFEGLTPQISELALKVYSDRSLGEGGREFLTFHAKEDIAHTRLVKSLIKTIAQDHPESVDAMKRGFERFRYVYPLRVWNAALERVLQT